jgi:hypothetical protein
VKRRAKVKHDFEARVDLVSSFNRQKGTERRIGDGGYEDLRSFAYPPTAWAVISVLSGAVKVAPRIGVFALAEMVKDLRGDQGNGTRKAVGTGAREKKPTQHLGHPLGLAMKLG